MCGAHGPLKDKPVVVAIAPWSATFCQECSTPWKGWLVLKFWISVKYMKVRHHQRRNSFWGVRPIFLFLFFGLWGCLVRLFEHSLCCFFCREAHCKNLLKKSFPHNVTYDLFSGRLFFCESWCNFSLASIAAPQGQDNYKTPWTSISSPKHLM